METKIQHFNRISSGRHLNLNKCLSEALCDSSKDTPPIFQLRGYGQITSKSNPPFKTINKEKEKSKKV
jgi:hypothetical protein